MKQSFLVAAAFVLTFAAGVLTGGLLVRQLAAPPPFEREIRRPLMSPRRLFDVDKMQKQLDLSDTQRQHVEAVLKKYREQIQEHLARVEPTMGELMRGLRSEIEQILTPEQREKFQRTASPFWRRSPRGRGRFEPDSMPVLPPPEANEAMP